MRKSLLLSCVLLFAACENDPAYEPPGPPPPPVISADPATKALCDEMGDAIGDLCDACPGLANQVTNGECREFGHELGWCENVKTVDQDRLADCMTWLAEPACTQAWSDAELKDCRDAWTH